MNREILEPGTCPDSFALCPVAIGTYRGDKALFVCIDGPQD